MRPFKQIKALIRAGKEFYIYDKRSFLAKKRFIYHELYKINHRFKSSNVWLCINRISCDNG